jgi:hypothetical protein
VDAVGEKCDADILVCKAAWTLVQTGMSASLFTESRQKTAGHDPINKASDGMADGS